MPLTPVDIDRIAHLARLGLGTDERRRMGAQLDDFFTIVEQMRAVDTRGVEPLAYPGAATLPPVALRLRDDVAVITEPGRREAYLQNAPAAEGGLFLVPRVIE